MGNGRGGVGAGMGEKWQEWGKWEGGGEGGREGGGGEGNMTGFEGNTNEACDSLSRFCLACAVR